MKSIITSIQPYFVFLIIARIMGWNIPQEKRIEVRKNFPKDKTWNKKVAIYCTKSQRSFKRIPAKYQPFMKKFLGKVIGEFVCDSIRKGRGDNFIAAYYHNNPSETCLTDEELVLYANYGKPLYFWHISDLKIYDKPKELGEFYGKTNCDYVNTGYCKICADDCKYHEGEFYHSLTRPPQSWCYVEE